MSWLGLGKKRISVLFSYVTYVTSRMLLIWHKWTTVNISIIKVIASLIQRFLLLVGKEEAGWERKVGERFVPLPCLYSFIFISFHPDRRWLVDLVFFPVTPPGRVKRKKRAVIDPSPPRLQITVSVFRPQTIDSPSPLMFKPHADCGG